MNPLKKMLIGLLTYILINLVFLLGISFTIKGVLIDGIINSGIVKDVFSSNFSIGNYNSDIDIGNNNTFINDILENKEVSSKLSEDEDLKKLVDNYVTLTINSVIDDNDNSEIDIEDDVINYITNNKSDIEKMTGKSITDEDIDKLKESFKDKEITKQYKDNISNTKNSFSEMAKSILKGYNFLISSKFKILVIVLILIVSLLIALVKWSYYKWIKNLSYSFIIGGISNIIIGLLGSYYVNNILKVSSSFVMPIINVGLIFSVFGLLVFVVYLIIAKNILGKDDGHVVS